MKRIGILMMVVMVLTGCVQQMDLTEQESETIAAYAASVTLNHDKHYSKKLVENESQEETKKDTNELSESVEPVTNTATLDNDTNQMLSSEEVANLEKTDIASLLHLEGFQITYDGYLFTKKYQESDPNASYTATSLDDNLFLIMKFKVKNTTDETKVCDILSLSPKLMVSVNGSEPVSTFASLLSNDMSTLMDEIGAQESKEVVLLIEVPNGYEQNISTMALTVIVDSKSSTVDLIS